MVTSREPVQCDKELYGKKLKQVEQFSYTRKEYMFREGGGKKDAKNRCLKAAQVFYQLSPILGHKRNQHDHQDTDHKSDILPTLLYHSENWTLTSKERQMLTTTEMKCLRKAAGKTRIDNIRNFLSFSPSKKLDGE